MQMARRACARRSSKSIPHGSPDLRNQEGQRHARRAAILRGASNHDALRRPRGAGGGAGGAEAVRAEVRRRGARGPGGEAVRRPRPRAGALRRRAVARDPRRGADAAEDAARALAAAPDDRHRRRRVEAVGHGGEGMSVLTASGVSVEFGPTVLFRDITVTIGAGDRWGVVGRNGTGKTTFFKLFTGEMQPTKGTVSRLPGTRVSLLEQHRDFGGATTVWEAAAGQFADLLALEKSLAQQAEAMGAAGERV